MIPVPILIRLGLAAAGVVGIFKLIEGFSNDDAKESNQNRNPGTHRDISSGERDGGTQSNGTGALNNGESTDSGYDYSTGDNRDHQPDNAASSGKTESSIEGANNAKHQTDNDGGANDIGDNVRG